jgi:pSer/pThr/pTyr-binding forkhead associated (FHA) protein
VALLLLNNEVAIHLRGKDDFTLGRSTKGQTIIPDIDLNPYDAYQAGVSRLHANIRISGSEIFIHDMGSVNGTYLNGKRLDANLEYPVHHGDVLTVGQLKIQVLMKEE